MKNKKVWYGAAAIVIVILVIWFLSGGKKEQFKGKVIGFSSRLNTILVPQAFMDWSNHEFAPEEHSDPTRLIVEVGNPGDENITKYLEDNGYEVEVKRIGIPDKFVMHGTVAELRQICGMDAQSISEVLV